MFDVAWQHRQTEVDELQYKLAAAEERASICLDYKNIYLADRDDLQKRVDRTLSLINKLHLFGVIRSHTVAELEQALKGGKEN